MKANAKKLLYFTRSERSGIAVFALLCVFLFWLPSRFSHWQPREKTDFSHFQQEIAGFKARQTSAPPTGPGAAADTIDPNTATEAQLVAIGLPVRTAETILKYRTKGGFFRYKEDLKKIYSIDEAQYEAVASFIDLPSAQQEDRQRALLVKNVPEVSPEPFDPNTATEEQLLKLGLPDRVVQTLLRYRSRGGVFRRPEDLQKVYGLSAEQYEALAPFIRFGGIGEQETVGSRSTEASFLLDINRSDAADWQRLPGIGPVLSARIVKFRDKLGGFAGVAQVAETYGLPDSTFQRIAARLVASPIPDLLEINRASVEDLAAHPYIDWRQARAIVHYRIQHGPLQDLEDFGKIQAMTEAERNRLAPYLSFE